MYAKNVGETKGFFCLTLNKRIAKKALGNLTLKVDVNLIIIMWLAP